MAKRGETRPWKVRFEWTNGVKGVHTFTSQDEAEMCADEIRRYGEVREDIDVTVTVTHEPKPIFVLTYCFVCDQNVKGVLDIETETAKPLRHADGHGLSCSGRMFPSDEFEPMPAEASR